MTRDLDAEFAAEDAFVTFLRTEKGKELAMKEYAAIIDEQAFEDFKQEAYDKGYDDGWGELASSVENAITR